MLFKFILPAVWLFAAFTPLAAGAEAAIGKDCLLSGKKLYGNVQVVDTFPDFKVKIVTHHPTLNVKETAHMATRCGEWRFVDTHPDFTIQYVDHFPDLKIRFVDHFPGVP